MLKSECGQDRRLGFWFGLQGHLGAVVHSGIRLGLGLRAWSEMS